MKIKVSDLVFGGVIFAIVVLAFAVAFPDNDAVLAIADAIADAITVLAIVVLGALVAALVEDGKSK